MKGNTYRSSFIMIRYMLPFLLGVAARAWLSERSVLLILLLSVLLLVASWLVFRARALLFILLVATGTVFQHVAMTHVADTRWAGKRDFRAVLASDVTLKNNVCYIDALLTEIDGTIISPLKVKLAMKVPSDMGRLNTKTGEINLEGGQYKSIIGRLKSGVGLHCHATLTPIKKSDKQNFDYSLYLLSQGFRYHTYLTAGTYAIDSTSEQQLSPWHALRLSALSVRSRLLHVYPDNGIVGNRLAVLSALTLGDKSMVTTSIRNVYSESGASHVLALSGLHISIIFFVLMLLLGRGDKPVSWNVAVKVLALVIVWLYVWMVGMPVSAIRSALMLSVCGVSYAMQRQRFTLNSLALAAFLVLLINPMSVFDVGFQLSFTAVFSILLFYDKIFQLFPSLLQQCRPVRWVIQMVSVSAAAQLGVAPLTLYYFGIFPVYFLLSNLVVLPLVTLLLYGALLLLLLSWVPFARVLLSDLVYTLVGWLNDVLSAIASLPGSSISGISMSNESLLFAYVLIFFVYKFLVKINRNKVSSPEIYIGE